MTPHTDSPPAAAPPWRAAHGVGISQTVLVVSEPFGPGLPAAAVAAAIARGLRADGALMVDLCPLSGIGAGNDDARALPAPGAGHADARARPAPGAGDARALLNALDFDARMRSARAMVVAARRLQERALAGSVTFEIATRARQGGVPAYAVTSENALEPFDARILDLQWVLRADSRRALAAAGRRLAGIV